MIVRVVRALEDMWRVEERGSGLAPATAAQHGPVAVFRANDPGGPGSKPFSDRKLKIQTALEKASDHRVALLAAMIISTAPAR